MKKLAFGSLLFAMCISGQAFGCLRSQAQVVGTGVGASATSGVCMITVRIEKFVNHRVCKIRGLKIGSEIDVATNMPAKKCPLDEVTLTGTVYTAGHGYRFEGEIH